MQYVEQSTFLFNGYKPRAQNIAGSVGLPQVELNPPKDPETFLQLGCLGEILC